MIRRTMVFPLIFPLAISISGCIGESNCRQSNLRAENNDTMQQNSYQNFTIEEPLTVQRSRTTVGKFNSEIIFMADQIERNADRKSLENTFVVTTVSNLNNLAETSAFGRLFTENLIHELQVRKWKVYEVRLTKDIAINSTGEFSLSRDTQRIRDIYKIGGIVVGTYAVAEGHIIVNSRVIDMNSGIISSSGQIHIPLNWYTDSLLYNDDRQKVMKIVGDNPVSNKLKPSGADLESSKWIKIEDIAK